MASSPPAGRRERNPPPRRRRRIVAGLALILALLIGLNAYALNHETAKAHLTVPGAALIDTTSGPLQVLDTGPRDAAAPKLPLVLIHGSGGAINWWDDLILKLRGQRRIIALDLLGYGGSAKPDSSYSIESQAGLVAQVLSRLGVTRAVAVGHSLGGSVATALAENSPDLVAGVVLIDSSPDSATAGLDLTAKAALTPVIGPLIWRLAPDSARRRALSRAFAPGTPVPDRFVADLKAMTYPAYRKSARASDSYVDQSSLPDRLQPTGLPLLVIFGEQDQLYPAREALSAYAGIPGVRTVLIPDSGHSPQVEAPGRTANEILGFADRIESSDRARALAAKRHAAKRDAAARRAAARARQKQRARSRNRRNRTPAKAGPGRPGGSGNARER